MSTQVFIMAFAVSYLGSVPPGAINITSMQLSVRGQRRAAFFFALGASVTELVYAGLTVRFQIYLSDQPFFNYYFQLVSSLAIITLGIINLFARNRTTQMTENKIQLKGRNGFVKGVILGLLNPLTIPFWLTITIYLQANHWIVLDSTGFYYYTMGIAIGTFSLLLTVNKLGSRFTEIASNTFIVYKIPGITFLLLGGYGLFTWLF